MLNSTYLTAGDLILTSFALCTFNLPKTQNQYSLLLLLISFMTYKSLSHSVSMVVQWCFHHHTMPPKHAIRALLFDKLHVYVDGQ